jgi:hypothetical protein
MDPKACLDLAEAALDEQDLNEAAEHLCDYSNWRARGGWGHEHDTRYRTLEARFGEACDDYWVSNKRAP